MEPFYPFRGEHRPPQGPPPSSELLRVKEALQRAMARVRELEAEVNEKDSKIEVLEDQKMRIAFELSEVRASLDGARATAP